MAVKMERESCVLSLPFSALTLLVQQREGHPTCKQKLDVGYVGGDILTRTLHVL